MRVSQLARKLNILPADVLAALPDGAFQAEGAYNARLTPEQVEEVVRFFRPGQWEKVLSDLKTVQEETEATAQKGEISRSATGADVQTALPVNSQSAEAEINETQSSVQPVAVQLQEVEVIRAPKVELPGLRVVGKIEIPEKKKPEVPAKQEEKEQRPVQRLMRARTSAKEKHKVRPEKNPIAVARERAKREAERQRKKEAELEKQRKTERYLKKIAQRKAQLHHRAPAKSNQPKTEQAYQNHLTGVTEPHLTLWQRFKKWLFRE